MRVSTSPPPPVPEIIARAEQKLARLARELDAHRVERAPSITLGVEIVVALKEATRALAAHIEDHHERASSYPRLRADGFCRCDGCKLGRSALTRLAGSGREVAPGADQQETT